MFWKRLLSFIYLFVIFTFPVFVIIVLTPMLWKNYSLGRKQVLALKNDFMSGKVDVYNSDGFPDLFKLERVQKDNLFVNYIRVHNDKGFSMSGGIEQKFKFFQRGEYNRYPWQKIIQISLPDPLKSKNFTVDLIVNMVSPQILQMVLLRTMGGLIFVLFLAIMYRIVEGSIIKKSRLNLIYSSSGGISLPRTRIKQKNSQTVPDFSLDIPERTVFIENNKMPKASSAKLDTNFLDSLDNLLNIEEINEINGTRSNNKNKDTTPEDILDYLEGSNMLNTQDKIQDLEDFIVTPNNGKTLNSENDTFNFSDMTDIEVEDKFLDELNDNSLDSKYELDSEDKPIFKKFPEPLLLKLPVQPSISDTDPEQEKDGFQLSPIECESIINNSEILSLVSDELKKAIKEEEDFNLLVFSLKFQKGIREVRNFFLERKNFVVRDFSANVYGVFINKMSLEQVYGIAGEFAYFMEKYANIVAIGISSVCDRQVQVRHLLKESVSALFEAINSEVCIIGFRPDIKMYNKIYENFDDMNYVTVK